MSITTIDSQVQTKIDGANLIAQQSVSQAQTFLASLVSSATEIDIPYAEVPESFVILPPFPFDAAKPDRPTVSSIIVRAPEVPNFYIPTITLENVPELNTAEPTIDIPSVPDASLPQSPTEPTLNSVSIPLKPVYSLPSAPSINTITIPMAPALTMSEFQGSMPTDDIIAPVNTFEFTEAEYISNLLDAVKAKLLNNVENGGTGLAPDVEQKIWERQSERDNLALQEAVNATIDTWTARGFTLPNGIITAQLQELYEKFEYAKLDRSRDIAIKQADLAQINTQFAITSSLTLENMELQHAENVANRALQAGRTTVDVGIAIFNAQVTKYNAKLEAYKTQAQVFESLIRGELVKVEVFKAELEGKRIEAGIQAQYIEIYKAQIDAVTALMNIYRTEVDTARIASDIERIKLEVFREKVNAFQAEVAAKATEYQMFKARIDGEMAKAQVYEIQVRAHAQVVDAYKSNADIRIAEAKAQIDAERLELDKFVADVQRYRAEAETETANLKALIDMYQAETMTYNADINKSEAETRLRVEQQRMVIQKAEHNLQMALQASQTNLQAFVSVANIKVNAAQAGGNFYANLAASALNTLSVVLQMGSSAQTTKTETAVI